MKYRKNRRVQQQLIHAGDCLYRSSKTHIYYAIFERDGRQVKRSLKTADPELAKRRREDLRLKVERLTTGDATTQVFAEYDPKKPTVLVGGLAKRWFDAVGVSIKPKTVAMYQHTIKMLARHFGKLTVRGIDLHRIEQWASQRSSEVGARSYNVELDVLRRILDYACTHGLILDNPAKRLARRKLGKKNIHIPTKEQFRQIVQTMRKNGGGDSADLVEFLGYSGCRLAEVVGDAAFGKVPMKWSDVDFKRKTFTVAGKGRGEEGKSRTVPLFPALESLLLRLQEKLPQPPRSEDPIFPIQSAKTCLVTACRQLKLPRFSHHTMRHFFCSNAIETVTDFKVIAGWLGHSDGGILVAKTYGHLRSEHSAAAAKHMNWSVTNDKPSTAQ